MPTLLIVANCPSANTRKLWRAVLTGARNPDIQRINARALQPLDADANDVLAADGIILGTTENFGAMSGLIKDFLERIYYPCREKTQGMPVAVYVKGGLDGQGAKRGVESILSGLNWKMVQPTRVFKGEYCEQFRAECEQLGMLMAAGLADNIF